MNNNYSITVVIPTIGRESINSSIQSILYQTQKVTDVIICYDGDNYENFYKSMSTQYSYLLDDKTLKILNVGPFSGGNVARQKGIEESNSHFIALLDDDDLWEKDHLEDLLSYITPAMTSILLSSSATIMEEGKKNLKVPPRLISNGETIPDYLFRVNGIKLDCGFIQSSLMLFSRQLALEVPFDVKLRYHQDIDWLIRLCDSGINFRYIQSPKHTVKYMSTPFSVSKKISGADSITWANKRFTNPRLLGDFVLTQSYNYARSNGSLFDELKVLLWALNNAKPSSYSVIRFFIKFTRFDSILRKLYR
ncbi:glycosyltransferase family 2 protein [Raoultella terrigena]|uniref:glycosyltransferase family 2 protein n=1 Tax=Raoultella terrigena TaxID=577 RepID=UPI00384E68C0